VAASLLEALLVGEAVAPALRPNCEIVVGARALRFGLPELRAALTRLAPGDVAAYIVPLDTPPLKRLWTLVTLPLRLRRAAALFEHSRLSVVGRYGVDPHMEAPAFVYELNSAAAMYADRSLRARGSGRLLRAVLAKCFGCDPAVGAVALIGRKR
jgi:hypothetical protein